MLATLALLTQVLAVPVESPADDRPVRLWLGASPVERGATLPVYVAVNTPGYLLVLRAATDGHVEIVYPADPRSRGEIQPGAYALRGANGRPALVTNERNGTGLVLAALSPRPFRYDEFLRGDAWNREAMIASWAGADGVGTLTDIVQRMLGDGWFTYDMAIYTVGSRAPRTVAPPTSVVAEAEPLTPTIGVCNGCTIVYQATPAQPVVEQTIVQQTFVEPVVLVPFGDRFVGSHRQRRRERPRFKTEGICQTGVDCPPGTGSPAKAMLVMSPIGRREPLKAPSPPADPRLAPEVRTAVVVSAPIPVARRAAPATRIVRTGSRFATNPGLSPGVGAAPQAPAAAPQTRTIALPRAYRRR
jgi:hypothetical protein